MKIRYIWASLIILSALDATQTMAAGSVTVSGRVYLSAGNAGVANAAICLCGGNGYAYTDADGKWSVTLEAGVGYCARVVGGVPAGDVAEAVANNREIGGSETY